MKCGILPAVASIAALVAGSVNAQQTAKPPAKAEDSAQLESITVAATKRSEPLQTVPIAITVLTGDKLEQTNINTLGAISAQVPTLNFRANASSRDTSLYIRGIGTISTSPGVEPTVSMVVNGVV